MKGKLIKALANSQKAWLGFCAVAIFVTRTFCRAKFERARLGAESSAALSWMFRWSEIPWRTLLQANTFILARRFGITRARLVVDETDTFVARLAHAENLA